VFYIMGGRERNTYRWVESVCGREREKGIEGK
jgi:hypothetical protein